MKAVWVIIVIAVFVLGIIWCSGYQEARDLVGSKSASILTIGLLTHDMNPIEKSGFMYYMKKKTNYIEHITDLTNLFPF